MINRTHSSTEPRKHCHNCGYSFSITNLSVNLGLALLKAMVGVLSGSRALIAAALYSINDVLSAIIVLVSLKLGNQPADDDHHYGHGKVEFVAVGLVALILATGVFLILYFTLIDLLSGVSTGPHAIAIAVAALSLFANLLLSRKGFCAARTLSSPSIYSSAEHLKADAISSAAVLVGVAAASLGLHLLDQIIALFESLHILWLSGSLFGKSVKGLMDSSLPKNELNQMKQIVSNVEDVRCIFDLKTRIAGSQAWADILVGVPSEYTVYQAQEICNKVRKKIKSEFHKPVQMHVGFRSYIDRDTPQVADAAGDKSYAK